MRRGRAGRPFRQLPKGGDLPHHLAGAVSTEYPIGPAAEDGLCIGTARPATAAAPCGPGSRPAADARTDRVFRDAVIRTWPVLSPRHNRSP